MVFHLREILFFVIFLFHVCFSGCLGAVVRSKEGVANSTDNATVSSKGSHNATNEARGFGSYSSPVGGGKQSEISYTRILDEKSDVKLENENLQAGATGFRKKRDSLESDEDLFEFMVRIANTPAEWERIRRVLSRIKPEDIVMQNNTKSKTEIKSQTKVSSQDEITENRSNDTWPFYQFPQISKTFSSDRDPNGVNTGWPSDESVIRYVDGYLKNDAYYHDVNSEIDELRDIDNEVDAEFNISLSNIRNSSFNSQDIYSPNSVGTPNIQYTAKHMGLISEHDLNNVRTLNMQYTTEQDMGLISKHDLNKVKIPNIQYAAEQDMGLISKQDLLISGWSHNNETNEIQEPVYPILYGPFTVDRNVYPDISDPSLLDLGKSVIGNQTEVEAMSTLSYDPEAIVKKKIRARRRHSRKKHKKHV